MNLFLKEREQKVNWRCRRRAAGRRFIMKKYCTKCGHEFEATGREVICPACKAQAAEDAKRAAVLKAKRASWNGESVPVRISGRASTIIRRYGAANGLPFAAALDDLLKSTDYFKSTGGKWEDVTPYKSHRRDKHATETENTQEVPQEVKKAAQEVKQVIQKIKTTQAAKSASKTTSKTVKKVATAAGKTGGKE